MHVGNLRRYIEALGTLEITVRFPDASVVLTNIGSDSRCGVTAKSQRGTFIMGR
jgi:hypothetical protein